MTDGTKEGWNTTGTVVNVTELGYVLKLSQASGKDFTSSVFTVLPDDIYVFKFGIESLTTLTGSQGLFIGLTHGQPFNVYRYDFTQKKWVLSASSFTNAYFLYDYIAKARRYYTTYILGSRVDIANVPGPVYTDRTYSIYCLQLTGIYTTCRIRSGYNGGQPADAAWYLIQPQVFRTGEGTVIARNILVEDLTAITGKFGKIKDDTVYAGTEESSNFWNLETSVLSILWEEFKVFRVGQDKTARPVFHANPGSSAGKESSEFRGAFRV